MNKTTIGISTLLMIALAITLCSCTTQPITPKPPVTNKPAENNFTNIQNNQPALILNNFTDANNQFAIDLYLKYKSEKGNVFFSPYSITSALAMTYEGARGLTAEEMQKALHLPNDKTKIRADFAQIYNTINKADKPYQLSTANALWAQKDYQFLKEYLNTTSTYYAGKATNLDFAADTENSRKTINTWVEGKTNDRIKDLIPAGMLDPETKLVLTNAVYFKANWSEPFKAENTRNEQFTLSNGTSVDAKMMHITSYYNYGETSNLQILEMPYLGDDLSMLIILPKENSLNEVENSISTKNMDEWEKAMQQEKVQVSLPKFKFETKYLMANDLAQMGMPIAFTDDADFSGMTGKMDLKISQVIHQTFLEVAEYGTEAAAATAVIMMPTMAIQQPTQSPKIFTADHPFIFAIKEKSTGNILFLGRLSDPSK